MGDTQTLVASDAQRKWASGFTGVDLDKSKGPGTPPAAAATPAASAGDERVKAMDASWQAAVQGNDWKAAATVVNGFSPDDLKKRLAPLSAEQRDNLHKGALDGGLGDKSAVAQATEKLVAGGLAGTAAGWELATPEIDCGYAKIKATAKASITYSLVEAGDPVAVAKFKDGKPQIEAALSKKLGEGLKVKGGGTIEKEKGNVSAELEFESCKALKHSFSFEILSKDLKTGKVKFAEMQASNTLTVAERTIDVVGVKIKLSGKIAIGLTVSPDWKAIAKYAAKELGVMIAEDAAAGVAAGGTGTAGAVAVAAAPVAGILGGIAGGFALTAGICASIGKLKDLAKDCLEVSRQAQIELLSYAKSYGSTMRGKPGSHKQGSDDAESALREIMGKTPGMTHEQAVQAAIDSKQNYEELAFRRLLPIIRAKVEATYKEKVGATGWFFSHEDLTRDMAYFLGENDHYRD